MAAPGIPPAPPLPGPAAAAHTLASSLMTPFAGPQLIAYLAARNLHRTATLALIANTWPEFEDRVVRPFVDGVEIAGTRHEAPDGEQVVVQAIMHHMWAEARKQWTTHIAVPAPAAPPAPAAGSPGAVVPALPGDKPPKTFPEWGPLVKRYNEVTIAGEPRDFPTNLLLGAEEVLARMYFEHTKSKEYTAVGLGEILQRRTFTAAMEVNPLATRRHKEKGQPIRVVDGELVQSRDDPWNPKGVLGVIDGIEAVRWAWTLTGVATEKGAAEYAQWWTSKARQRPSQLEAITEYWDASSRRLAMQMRLRRTFEEVTAEIMKDQAAFLDILSRPRPSAKQRTSEGYNPPDPELDGHHSRAASPRRQTGPGPRHGTRGGAGSRGSRESLARRIRSPRPAGAAAAAAGSQRGEPAASPASSPAGRIGRMTGGGPSRTVPSRGRTAAGSERPRRRTATAPTSRGARDSTGPRLGLRPRGGYPTGARRSRWQHGAGSWAGARARQIYADLSL